MKFIYILFFWIFLNIILSAILDYALKTHPQSNWTINILHSEFWASIEWMFLVPAQMIGNTFLTATQLSLTSFFFNYLGQVIIQIKDAKLTTIDDYSTLLMILVGLYISITKMFD